jgi:NTE family protein
LSLDVVIGDNPRYYFNYFIDNGYIPGFGLYSSGMTFDLKNFDNNTTETWDWFRNEVFIQSVWKDKFAIGGGLSHDYFESERNGANKIVEKYLNPYVFLKATPKTTATFRQEVSILTRKEKS